MLNFAEQTGSGAVIVVWSFLDTSGSRIYMYTSLLYTRVQIQVRVQSFPIRAQRQHPSFVFFTLTCTYVLEYITL